jgi:hypothetical protein
VEGSSGWLSLGKYGEMGARVLIAISGPVDNKANCTVANKIASYTQVVVVVVYALATEVKKRSGHLRRDLPCGVG